MKNKTTRFITVSLISILLLCVIVFSFLAFYTNRKSSETISEVGTLYMSGLNEQISLHFQTTVGLRLSQIEALSTTIPPTDGDQAPLRAELTYNAEAREFNYLALYAPDGTFEMLDGDMVQLADPESFHNSLIAGNKKVAIGMDADGNKIVLFGVPCPYRMSDGHEGLALVGGLPVEYISTTLSLEMDSTLVYSQIIRRDGSYIIANDNVESENYFERIRSALGEKHRDEAERYVAGLQEAMHENEVYSAVLNTRDGRRHLHCTPLPFSEWYLVTVMPYGAIDQSVSQLGHVLVMLAFVCCCILLGALLLMFAKYYSITRQQMEDLTAAREEAIRASRAKSEFLSNMSHDIRTPMNAIVGMTAIATTNLNNPQQVQSCLRKITLSSKHLLGLINDILDMSKIESGKMTLSIDQVSLREVMDGIVSIVQPQVRAKKQQFDVFISDISAEEVCCDSVRLNQVLLNLLSNAIKFTPEGGRIELALTEEPSPQGNEYVRIHLRVTDTGIGMSPEFQKNIFESFAREDNARVHRTEGAGLGMAITKFIVVNMMGGAIEVDSELGKGSEFRVTLDFLRADVTEEEMLLPDWEMLVVDDDQILCESAVASLQQIGIRAEWTLDAGSAIQKMRERQSKNHNYDIILLDWKLPDMDGIAAAREIRRCVGDATPILLISAYDWSEIEDEARAAGVSGFISKPLFKSTLYYGLKPFMGGLQADESAAPEQLSSFAGRHVLMAEDNELNWEVASELLRELELELDWAEDGRLCVEKFKASPVGYYDAILMDLRMPVMTGYEATEAIRALERPDADLPIIAMTADAFAEDVQRCLDCGMNAHIAKPIDVKEVARQLTKWMKPRAQDAPEKG